VSTGVTDESGREERQWYGLVGAVAYLLVLMPIAVIHSWEFPTPVGMMLRLLRPRVAESVLGIQPLVVRLVPAAGPRARPSLYVDSQLVPWGEFDNVLQKEISRRPPDWPVYLGGDPDLEWGYGVYVIGRIY